MIQNVKNFDDDFILPFSIYTTSEPSQGHLPNRHNLIINLFGTGDCACQQGFPEIRKKKYISVLTYW